MDINKIFTILFEILGLGCIFAILFWMMGLVEGKVPEPFKQVIGWLKIFVMLLCGVFAIYFIMDLVGLNTSGPLLVKH